MALRYLDSFGFLRTALVGYCSNNTFFRLEDAVLGAGELIVCVYYSIAPLNI